MRKRPTEWRTCSAEETEQVAEQLVHCLQPDTLILLYGTLGAGKTTFVRGLARALGITEPIRSPTFTLVHEYTIQHPPTLKGLPLFHLDLYRIEEPHQLAPLGIEELFELGGVVVVEWGERLEGFPYEGLVAQCWRLEFEINPDSTRTIRWKVK